MSRRPTDVLKTLPDSKVIERLESWHKFYLQEIETRYKGIHLNLKLLRHAVESCLLDLNRMKNFHGIEYADCHKRAAFSMLWVVRAHPIQLNTDVNLTESLMVINEIYAIHLGINHLEIAVSSISSKYFRNLIYILHFRNPAPEILASSMYLLECAIRKIIRDLKHSLDQGAKTWPYPVINNKGHPKMVLR